MFQVRSSLRNVTDIFVMGACLITESLVLHCLCRERGLGPSVFHGVSMGGHMAALSATVIPEPVGVVPCLAWTSASLTFTEGVLSGAINWPLLESQLRANREYGNDILAMCRSERNAFAAGVDFARDLYSSIRWEDEVAKKPEPTISNSSSSNSNGEGETLKEKGKRLSSIYETLDGVLSALRPLRGRSRSPSDPDDDDLRQEAFHFMRGIMDECTHLKNFAVPADPSLCLAVTAERDAYQPTEGVRPITEVWPGARMRHLRGQGHISSFLFKQAIFREAIYEVMDMLLEKHPADKTNLFKEGS